jgi:hypothetical protein
MGFGCNFLIRVIDYKLGKKLKTIFIHPGLLYKTELIILVLFVFNISICGLNIYLYILL